MARWAPPIAVVFAYILAAMVADLPAWLHGVTHQMENGGLGDLSEQGWFLGYTPYALAHGQNPFFTTVINYPSGANLMANTSMILPSLVLAPITLMWGSIASFNVLLILCFAGSATTAYVLCRRYSTWRPAAFVGGLLFGFSPYMIGQGTLHLDLACVALLPLTLLVLDQVIMRVDGNPIVLGALLGVLAVGQLLISTEILAGEVVMALIGVAVLVLANPSEVVARSRRVGIAAATALAMFAVLAAYPLWTLFEGPQHIVGMAQPAAVLRPDKSDLLGFLLPTANQAIGSGFHDQLGTRLQGNLSESGSYLGVTLVIALVFLVFRYRRVGVVRFAALMSLLAMVFALGDHLRVDGHETGVPLPFDLLVRLPLLSSSVALRYMVFAFLFAAVVVAVGLDRLHADLRSVHLTRAGAAIACAAMVVVALVPLLPKWPYQISDTSVPAFFTSTLVKSVPTGTGVLTYPFPRTPFHSQAMLWQARSGFRFTIPGGYIITAESGSGTATFYGTPTLTEQLLNDAYDGAALPPLTPQMLVQVRADLKTWHTSTVVVDTRVGVSPASAVQMFETLFGRPPSRLGGADVWHVNSVSATG